MREPIAVESRMTYDDMKRYMWFHLLKRGKRLRASIIFMLIALGLCLLVLLTDIWLFGIEGLSVETWLAIGVVVILLPLYLCIVPLSAKRAFKTSKVHFDSTQRFEFRPDEVKIETTGQNVSGSSAYRYEAFHRVCEIKDAFYLYMNHNQALLMSKRNMKAADEDDLARLLEGKLGKKFIRCY